ncbi:hypothetical protein M378DRAFT_73426 [Amanita muscaria Koide BX008]|uniref:HD/PDEase domain-containing protein n=1 Tax=Amanita muscaria (strain Koide BX008) TaxID=946122 RepID=A0A0C2TKV7_AMAMK|nr:hypothetical protein M378DRAFT_73426 [Amanita muscaria Koide BX008]
MYPTPEEKAVIDDAEKLMVETMARYDPSHDAFHVQRVRKTALMIARSLEISPDLLTVELAALLHDVLDKKYVTPEQASDPYSFFLPFFQQARDIHGIDLIEDGRARQISLIIDNVSWTTEKKLREAGKWTKWHNECIELHCVQDADRLDAIGAFGVMRCAAYSAVRNSVLYAPLGDSVRPQSAIQHFHDKLLHIKDRLKTEAGKTMGVHRHKALLDFIQSLEDEYNVTLR